MRILTVELVLYKRFMLNNIDYIKVDLQKDLALIIGSNGSGKTSLLKAATMIPANKADFLPGGRSVVTAEHNGHRYIATSLFTNGSKYSFTKDGVELNGTESGTYGTATVQRELVERELNYTTLTHRLLIGDIRFTDLSVSKRRDILSSISPLKLNYATQVWERLKNNSRDIQGITKHLTNKLVECKTELTNMNYDTDLPNIQSTLETELNRLVSYSTVDIEDTSTLTDRLDKITRLLNDNFKEWDRYISRHVTDSAITNRSELLTKIGTLGGRRESITTKITSVSAEMLELNSTGAKVLDGTLSAMELDTKINDIEQEMSNLVTIDIGDADPKALLVEISNVSHSIHDIVDGCDVMYIYTGSEHKEITNKLNALTQEDRNIRSGIDNIKHEIDHLNKLDDTSLITCPKCTHRFSSDGIDRESVLTRLKDRLARGLSLLEDIKPKLQNAQLNNYNLNLYEDARVKLNTIKSRSILPSDFWYPEYSPLEFLVNTNKLSIHCLKWTSMLKANISYNSLSNELDVCKAALALENKYGGNIKEKIAALDNELSSLHDLNSSIITELDTLNAVLSGYDKYERITLNSIKLLDDAMLLLDKLTTASIRDNAKQRCAKVYDRLAEIRNIVHRRDILDNNLDVLETDLNKALADRELLDMLSTHLSPNKGLIADQMLGFINSFLHEMNSVAAKVWGYNLTIAPCSMDDGVLNYKFPLQVEHGTTPDISDGSTGQRDIVNLAFTIVMRQYLGLDDYPLYLDETGASFDEFHRNRLMDYIKLIMDTGLCSQVLLVNHYETVHAGLTNHQVVVLDDRNIVVPDSYNTLVSFKEQ